MDWQRGKREREGHILIIINTRPKLAGKARQGPRFSIRMIIWIFYSNTETGAVTPLGRGAETLTALKILLLSLIADVKQS